MRNLLRLNGCLLEVLHHFGKRAAQDILVGKHPHRHIQVSRGDLLRHLGGLLKIRHHLVKGLAQHISVGKHLHLEIKIPLGNPLRHAGGFLQIRHHVHQGFTQHILIGKHPNLDIKVSHGNLFRYSGGILETLHYLLHGLQHLADLILPVSFNGHLHIPKSKMFIHPQRPAERNGYISADQQGEQDCDESAAPDHSRQYNHRRLVSAGGFLLRLGNICLVEFLQFVDDAPHFLKLLICRSQSQIKRKTAPLPGILNPAGHHLARQPLPLGKSLVIFG